ncbi:hypothetical protein DFJ43DRAFT_1161734 [Lentinula guzmanii]|uniref:histidinol-phosphate transaminase n=1 Tax=Lentinula guzmanii TaxID=2804957 RepID=A0AA38J1H4_9AGAR|nr:hypothetical protein DFJ43DRAFT_1161734 [Lentinula guzmanii]
MLHRLTLYLDMDLHQYPDPSHDPIKLRLGGIVVVDEADIDFASAGSSAMTLVKDNANICILQTLSKSFGLAAIRPGITIVQLPLIQVLTNTKAPYNISTPTAHLALSTLSASSLATIQNRNTYCLTSSST